MIPIAAILVICGLISFFASWRGARVALLRKKKKISAHEAKMISEMFDNKIKHIEDSIYFDIRTSAYCGNRYVKVRLDKDIEISHETIALHLKQNGYNVSWSFSADDDAYVYDIWW